MNRIVRKASSFLSSHPWSSLGSSLGQMHRTEMTHQPQQLQQWRGIRVKVYDGNLEQALAVMQRRITSSGMERLIKRQVTHHLKNSEKRVLARKNLERKIRSQDLAKKLRSILVKKIRGL